MRFGLLFPGQGAQTPGMGRALYEAFPEARAVFEASDEALGQSIARICFEGSADDLALTENTQPAILTTSIAALRVLEAGGLPRPAGAAGHSLGEYSAHVAAGTLRFPDAVATVRSRGRFMQEAVPVGVGTMAAVLGLEADVVDEICREAAEGRVVSAANLNSPGQIVIAGHVDAVERACTAAAARGARKAVPLPVSAPFHCALMEPAAIRLRAVLETLEFRDPDYPVHANANGRPVDSGVDARERLVEQVASPVRWIDVVEGMIANGIETFLELGPGKVLAGLVRRIDRRVTVVSVSDPEGVARALERFEEAS